MTSWSDPNVIRRIDVEAGELVVREFGDPSAPPMLFVHGALVAGSLWREVVPSVSKRYRCIVPDLPLGSHSVPMRPDADVGPKAIARMLFEILDALDIPSATFVANDSGGALSQFAATIQPERIDRLVLTNCDAFEVFPPKAFAYLGLLPRFPRLGASVGRMLARFPWMGRAPYAWGSLSSRRIPADLLASWTAPLATAEISRDVAKFFAGVEPGLLIPASRQLAEFERPIHLLWGNACPFFKMSLAQRIAETAPRAEVVGIPNARCFVMLDNPEQLIEEIIRAVPNVRTAGAA